jgi:hypothetical protein
LLKAVPFCRFAGGNDFPAAPDRGTVALRAPFRNQGSK